MLLVGLGSAEPSGVCRQNRRDVTGRNSNTMTSLGEILTRGDMIRNDVTGMASLRGSLARADMVTCHASRVTRRYGKMSLG